MLFTSAQDSIQASFVCSAEVKNKFVVPSVISSVSSVAFINAQAAATFVASVTSAQSSTFKCDNIAVLFTHRAIVPVVVTGLQLSTSNQSEPDTATLVTVPVFVVYPASFVSEETLSPACNALSAKTSDAFTLAHSFASSTTPASIVHVAPLQETVISHLSQSDIPPQVALIIGFSGSVLSTVIPVQATTLCTHSQVSPTGIAGTV